MVVHLLVAAQVLLGAPVVNAAAEALPEPEQAAEAHCADMMPDGGDEATPCPCCPEGSTDMTSCFSTCFAAHGAAHSFMIAPSKRIFATPVSHVLIHPAALAEPPLKPPPIV
jgi:hypothetical protein